jgi:hypothetical protein
MTVLTGAKADWYGRNFRPSEVLMQQCSKEVYQSVR